MRHLLRFAVILCFLIASSFVAAAQSTQDQSASVPRLITITGVYRPADGKAAGAVETVTLSVYVDEQGGAALFQETQQITIDDRGRYSVVLGAAHADGIPASVVASGGQWLGTVFERTGEVEGPRVRLTSVPYALRAAEADTLGGHPASDYVLTPGAAGDRKTTGGRSDVAAPASTINFLQKSVDGVNLGDSALYEAGGFVGLGTTAPLDLLHIRYTNTGGNLTGLAVQNLGNTATSYSGMLFYDQNNQLGQFQGFNNVTHEYRINNIAKNGASQFDGSINFMIGSNSRFFVSNGAVGIGTASPAAPGLEVSNALTGASFGYLAVSTFGNNTFGSALVGTKSRGTQAVPAPVQNNDSIALFGGGGRAATHPGAFGNGMEIRAAENFTDAAQGTTLNFYTTTRGTNSPTARMTIAHNGNVGIGTATPGNLLDIVKDGNDANIVATSFGAGFVPGIFFQAARGTLALPTAVQTGDVIGVVGGNGYGATDFGDVNAAIGMIATENWTDAARGTGMGFLTTPLGSTTMAINLAILSDGKIAMGTPIVNGFPTATDKLQVFGDVRVGAGAGGCVKDFSGAAIAGTCSSDRRFKRDITPFGPVLNQLTALQPVHYFWRATDFPDRHFGNDRTDGLIAQDVEQVLPELVATDSDGYKAINYSKLPLLTIQAVKELKSENDARKAENDALKQRVAELERLVTDLLATARR